MNSNLTLTSISRCLILFLSFLFFLFTVPMKKKNPLEHCINIFVVTAVVMVDHFSHQVALEE